MSLLGTIAVLTACTSAPQFQAALHRQPSVHPAPSSSPTLPSPSASDAGARQYAEGKAAEVRPGEYHYVVAEGDTFISIAARFNVCIADVETGLPPAEQGDFLSAGTPVDIRLGVWPLDSRGHAICKD